MATVNVNVADLEAVVRLACLTEHRDNAEQSALLRVAARVDRARNSQVSSNVALRGDPDSDKMWRDTGRNDEKGERIFARIRPESRLEREVDASRVLEDGDRRIRPSYEKAGNRKTVKR